MDVIQVQVFKASLPLRSGETIDEYSRSLQSAARGRLAELARGGLVQGYDNQKSEVWPAAVYHDRGVFSIFTPGAERTKTVQMQYARSDDGSFHFGDVDEVLPRTTYEPAGPDVVRKLHITATKDMLCPDDTAFARKASVEKREWDSAYISDLPDAAFAAILPGGKRDSSGKTVPRSLRLLPHHDKSVKSGSDNSSVDIPHLRNALARVNQIKAPADVRASAKRHLEEHAKDLLGSYTSDEDKALLRKALYG